MQCLQHNNNPAQPRPSTFLFSTSFNNQPLLTTMSHVRLSSSGSTRNLVTILKQTSPFEERVTRNGIQRDIHVVIKNSPFIVQIGVAKNCEIDLNHVAFEAFLLYDTEGDKGVDFVKVKPIEFKCVPSEAGDQVAIELRIKVLTSQHEDMFFKVAIQGQDPVTKQDIPNMRVITAPIKVISKPEQLKKRQPPPASKKRTVNDMVVEAVTRIEKQQSEQAILMEKLFEMVNPAKRIHHDMTNNWEFPVARTKEEFTGDFDTAFLQLLKSFAAVDPNHRAEKVRRIARTLNAADSECFSELVDMLTSEGLGQENGREARPMMNTTMINPPPMFEKHCNCAQCPHKHDLEKIDNIFFTSMMPPYGAAPNVLHTSVGSVNLGSSLDPENGVGVYPDFLTHSPPAEFLM